MTPNVSSSKVGMGSYMKYMSPSESNLQYCGFLWTNAYTTAVQAFPVSSSVVRLGKYESTFAARKGGFKFHNTIQLAESLTWREVVGSTVHSLPTNSKFNILTLCSC
jgi:hypothetical protein